MARNNVALPRVYNQFVFGSLRRKIVCQMFRHPIRSSNQFPILVTISSSKYIDLIVFNFYIKTIKRSGGRARGDVPIFVKYGIVTRAKEAIVVGFPVDLATEMRADAGQRDEIFRRLALALPGSDYGCTSIR